MGKRELVLVCAFVVLGIAVYQFTAPPRPPGSEGVTIGSIIRSLRRGVRGARATSTTDSTRTVAVAADATVLRLSISRVSDVTIAGEDRADIAAALHVVGRGYDESEARAAAGSVKLKIEPAGGAVVVSLDIANAVSLPRSVPPPQVTLTLTVPRRLSAHMDPHFGRLIVSNLADAEIMASRGETRVTGIAARLQLTHAGGALDIADTGSPKLTPRTTPASFKQSAAAPTTEPTPRDPT